MGMDQYLRAGIRGEDGNVSSVITLQQLRKDYEVDKAFVTIAKELSSDYKVYGSGGNVWARSATFEPSTLLAALQESRDLLHGDGEPSTELQHAVRTLYWLPAIWSQLSECIAAGWVVTYSMDC